EDGRRLFERAVPRCFGNAAIEDEKLGRLGTGVERNAGEHRGEHAVARLIRAAYDQDAFARAPAHHDPRVAVDVELLAEPERERTLAGEPVADVEAAGMGRLLRQLLSFAHAQPRRTPQRPGDERIVDEPRLRLSVADDPAAALVFGKLRLRLGLQLRDPFPSLIAIQVRDLAEVIAGVIAAAIVDDRLARQIARADQPPSVAAEFGQCLHSVVRHLHGYAQVDVAHHRGLMHQPDDPEALGAEHHVNAGAPSLLSELQEMPRRHALAVALEELLIL